MPVTGRQHIRSQIMEFFPIEGVARIHLRVSPPRGGMISAHGVAVPNGSRAGLYFSNLPLRLKAAPNAGFRFAGWNEPSPDQPDTLTHLVIAADTITALFEPDGSQPLPQSPTDFDGDGETGFPDFFLFADAFGGSDSRFDLDGSGAVDLGDFFLFADEFGEPVPE